MKRAIICLSVRPSVRLSRRSTASRGGFAAERPGDIDRLQAPAPSSSGAVARHSAANAGSRVDTDFSRARNVNGISTGVGTVRASDGLAL